MSSGAVPAARLAVIGGSGFYDMAELTEREEWNPETPFGQPSDAIVVGTLHGERVAFLPRHAGTGCSRRRSPRERTCGR